MTPAEIYSKVIYSKIISAFFMRPMNWALDIPAKMAYRGHMGVFQDQLDFWTWVQRNLPGWSYAEDWSNGYREIYFNTKLRAILTYCEGDVDLTVDEMDQEFNLRWKSAEEFYKNY